MAPSRRTVLRRGSLALAGVAAGCSADSETVSTTPDSGSDPPSTTATDGDGQATESSSVTIRVGERTSTDGAAVTVSDPRVRNLIYTRDAGATHHFRVVGDTGTQFLTVAVETSGVELTEYSLVAVTDGSPQGGKVYRMGGTDYSGRVWFRIPVDTVRSGAVEWRPANGQRHRWVLPDSVVAALGERPRFEVESFDVPDEFRREERFGATVTVRNAGNRDGQFLGVVLDQGPGSVPIAGPFEFPVAAGELVTRDISGYPVGVGGEETTAVLDWGLGTREETFSVA